MSGARQCHAESKNAGHGGLAGRSHNKFLCCRETGRGFAKAMV
ncbi:hypothetical protein AZ23_1927 [Bordetella bronchiseptica E010]|nr:hypothetical protein AZ23_1927 [Bordetella bronchiseptica E010]